MLTKTKLLLYLSCPYEFWMLHHRSANLPKTRLSADQEYFIKQGYQVQTFAEKLFTNEDGIDLQHEVIVDGLKVKADILLKQYIGNHLLEVKSTSKIRENGQLKETLLYDLAFQKYVFELSGISIAKTSFVFVNKHYIYPGGEIQIEDFLIVEDVTEEINAAIPKVIEYIQAAKQLAQEKSIPNWNELDFCTNKFNCSFVQHFHGHRIPEFSVFQLPRIHKSKLSPLLLNGIWNVMDITKEYALTPAQELHVQTAQSGQSYINLPQIQKMLSELEYPLYFLDYEAINPAIPVAVGTQPYKHMVFQYSLHIIESPKSEPIHKDFLATQKEYPARDLVKALAKDISTAKGSVIVWNKGFEKGRNNDLAVRFPIYADFLQDVNNRIFDLMLIFSQHHYVDKGFKGSASIKQVLPILAPELDYNQLDISQGMQAAVMWIKSFDPQLSTTERLKIRSDLRAYCQMDTWAMVRIWEELSQL